MDSDRIAIPRRVKPGLPGAASASAACSATSSSVPSCHGRSPLGGEPAPVCAVLAQPSRACAAHAPPVRVPSAPPVPAPPFVSAAAAISLSAAAPSAPPPPPPAQPSPLPSRPTGCRNALEFDVLAKIGEGTFGIVTRARDPRTGELVALKKIKFIQQLAEFPVTTIREIRALRRLQHPNVVELREVVTTTHAAPVAPAAPPGGSSAAQPSQQQPPSAPPLGDVFMVFPYAENDLAGLLRTARNPSSGFSMTPERIRSYMHQLLLGLAHIHAQGWVHRDIKTANLLVTNANVLSIADFGLAKQVSAHNTPLVVTLWYRSPELLYQDPNASFPLDVWSAGCVFGEMLSGRELFCGEDAASQIQMIYKLCGVPDTDGWPDIQTRIGYNLLRPRHAFTPQFSSRFPRLPAPALDLLARLLTINPYKRITAAEALAHPYFQQGGSPPPPPSTLPPIAVGSAHEFEVNAARATAAAPPPPRRSPHGGPRDAQLAPQSGQKRGREGGEGGGGSQPPQRGGGADNRVAVAGGGAKLESAAAAGQGPPLPAAAVGAAGGGGRPVVSAASALATATLAKIRAGVALPKGGLAQLSALSRAAAAAAAPASAGLPAAAPAAAPRPAPVSAEGAGDEDDDPEPSNLFV